MCVVRVKFFTISLDFSPSEHKKRRNLSFPAAAAYFQLNADKSERSLFVVVHELSIFMSGRVCAVSSI
jgi:hypothetical protein